MNRTPGRFLVTAPKSGSGKTTVTCGLLLFLKRHGLRPAAIKCGPDYIDPMFHRAVLGVPTGNLDTFFTDDPVTRAILLDDTEGADIAVLEGAMGYFDGLGGNSVRGSACHVQDVTGTPAILVLDAKGGSVSLSAVADGFLHFPNEITARPGNGIAGIFLNRLSHGYAPRLIGRIEADCGIPVIGYLPELREVTVPSRHLGLVSPAEVPELRSRIEKIADVMERTVDLEKLIRIASSAGEMTGPVAGTEIREKEAAEAKERVVVAVARDAAFSFFYTENLRLLSRLGADLVFFSPVSGETLPEEAAGVMLGGGYPELCAGPLSENVRLKAKLRSDIAAGLPCIAECGGFLYLQKSLEGVDGHTYEMADVLPGSGFRTGSLRRFGYLEAVSRRDGLFGPAGTKLRGHEFHHWDTTDNGDAFVLKKPLSGHTEYAGICTETMSAGFPHFYYPSNPDAVRSFLRSCRKYADKRRQMR